MLNFVCRIVASCTAHLEEMTSANECIKNLGKYRSILSMTDSYSSRTRTAQSDPTWRQFRFSVGAPDAEAKFRTAVQEAQVRNQNARTYPSLYVFAFPAFRHRVRLKFANIGLPWLPSEKLAFYHTTWTLVQGDCPWARLWKWYQCFEAAPIDVELTCL